MTINILEERTYCLGVLLSRGNANDPHEAVPSYMQCQAINADRAGQSHLACAYRFAAKCAAENDYSSAWQAVNYSLLA